VYLFGRVFVWHICVLIPVSTGGKRAKFLEGLEKRHNHAVSEYDAQVDQLHERSMKKLQTLTQDMKGFLESADDEVRGNCSNARHGGIFGKCG
jgi:hypothetical protein